MSTSNYDDYLATYNGKALLVKYPLTEQGIWEVFGEDANCDLAGPHYTPSLGHLSGALIDVIKIAVDLQGFWQWGAGGIIQKITPLTTESTQAHRALKARKAKLEEELKQINSELKGA